MTSLPGNTGGTSTSSGNSNISVKSSAGISRNNDNGEDKSRQQQKRNGSQPLRDNLASWGGGGGSMLDVMMNSVQDVYSSYRQDSNNNRGGFKREKGVIDDEETDRLRRLEKKRRRKEEKARREAKATWKEEARREVQRQEQEEAAEIERKRLRKEERQKRRPQGLIPKQQLSSSSLRQQQQEEEAEAVKDPDVKAALQHAAEMRHRIESIKSEDRSKNAAADDFRANLRRIQTSLRNIFNASGNAPKVEDTSRARQLRPRHTEEDPRPDQQEAAVRAVDHEMEERETTPHTSGKADPAGLSVAADVRSPNDGTGYHEADISTTGSLDVIHPVGASSSSSYSSAPWETTISVDDTTGRCRQQLAASSIVSMDPSSSKEIRVVEEEAKSTEDDSGNADDSSNYGMDLSDYDDDAVTAVSVPWETTVSLEEVAKRRPKATEAALQGRTYRHHLQPQAGVYKSAITALHGSAVEEADSNKDDDDSSESSSRDGASSCSREEDSDSPSSSSGTEDDSDSDTSVSKERKGNADSDGSKCLDDDDEADDSEKLNPEKTGSSSHMEEAGTDEATRQHRKPRSRGRQVRFALGYDNGQAPEDNGDSSPGTTENDSDGEKNQDNNVSNGDCRENGEAMALQEREGTAMSAGSESLNDATENDDEDDREKFSLDEASSISSHEEEPESLGHRLGQAGQELSADHPGSIFHVVTGANKSSPPEEGQFGVNDQALIPHLHGRCNVAIEDSKPLPPKKAQIPVTSPPQERKTRDPPESRLGAMSNKGHRDPVGRSYHTSSFGHYDDGYNRYTDPSTDEEKVVPEIGQPCLPEEAVVHETALLAIRSERSPGGLSKEKDSASADHSSSYQSNAKELLSEATEKNHPKESETRLTDPEMGGLSSATSMSELERDGVELQRHQDEGSHYEDEPAPSCHIQPGEYHFEMESGETIASQEEYPTAHDHLADDISAEEGNHNENDYLPTIFECASSGDEASDNDEAPPPVAVNEGNAAAASHPVEVTVPGVADKDKQVASYLEPSPVDPEGPAAVAESDTAVGENNGQSYSSTHGTTDPHPDRPGWSWYIAPKIMVCDTDTGVPEGSPDVEACMPAPGSLSPAKQPATCTPPPVGKAHGCGWLPAAPATPLLVEAADCMERSVGVYSRESSWRSGETTDGITIGNSTKAREERAKINVLPVWLFLLVAVVGAICLAGSVTRTPPRAGFPPSLLDPTVGGSNPLPHTQTKRHHVPCANSAPCQYVVGALDEVMPEGTRSLINVPGTCQNWARDWLRTEPGILGYEIDRIRQRFVMSLLYCEMDGDNWLEAELWLSDLHECDWYQQIGVDPCSRDERYQIIRNSGVQMRGTLPPELAILDSLWEATFSDNMIEGTIPTDWARLTQLDSLDLSSNLLTGTLPDFVWKYEDMYHMDLSYNFLGGTIPETVHLTEPSLRVLLLGNNDISGTIPTGFGYIDWKRLHLEGNELVGTVPSNINAPRIEELLLHNNKGLGGTFPAADFATEFAAPKSNLVHLTLHNTNIVGDLNLMCPLFQDGSLQQLDVDLDRIPCECCSGPNSVDATD